MQERGGMGTRAFKRCLRSRDRLRDREERQKERKLREQGSKKVDAGPDIDVRTQDTDVPGNVLNVLKRAWEDVLAWVDVLKLAWEDVLAPTGTPDGVRTCWRRR